MFSCHKRGRSFRRMATVRKTAAGLLPHNAARRHTIKACMQALQRP